MSLRNRLLAAMTIVAAMLAIVAVVITATTRRHLVDQVDERLTTFAAEPSIRPTPPPLARAGDTSSDTGDDAESDAPVTTIDATPDDGPGGRPLARRGLGDLYQGLFVDGEVVYEVLADDGRDSLPRPQLTDASASLREGQRRFVTVGAVEGSTTYRALLTATEDGIVVRALPLDDVQETVRRLIVFQIAGTGGVLALLALVTWWVYRLGIRPIKQMTVAATEIADGDLTVRVPESSPGTESGDLAVALNTMLGTIHGALDEREESEARLRRFVADASHELRTPLTTIRGYAELYRHGGLAADAALDDAMSRTEQEASRMGRLVEDMLTLAKLDDGRPLRLTQVDLRKIADEVAADVGLAHPHRTIHVSGEATSAVADEDRIRQALLNVVSNALVHTGAPATVTVSVSTEQDRGVVAVTDTGAGLSADVTAKLKERFYRADPSRSRQRGGSGLGLAIVDEIVTAHGGTVEIDSVVGSGTTVRLTLPLAGPRIAPGPE